MCWCSSGLYVFRFPARTGWCVPALGRDAAARRAGDADHLDRAVEQARARERQQRELDRRREAAGRRDVLRAADRVAVELGQAVDERAEQLGVRVLGAVELLVGGRVAQPEVARQVDDRARRPRSARAPSSRSPCAAARAATTSQPAAASAGEMLLELEVGQRRRGSGAPRRAARRRGRPTRRARARRRGGEQAADHLRAAVAAAADDGCLESLHPANLALLCQILAARSIIGAAIRPLKRLTDQAEPDARNQQGERLAVVLTRTAFAAASPHLTWPPR